MLLTCCSSDSEVKAETRANANMGKTLIVYYSYMGNCKAIVNSLAAQIMADQLEIQPAEKGLKYEANNYALGTQLLNAIKANPNDASSYPAIDPVSVSLDDHQNIIIVTPLWWSQMAAIMQTYLFQNSAKLAGKTVAMIVSSHSSGISGVVADAQRLLPNVTWAGDALWINASNHSNRNSLIENWLPTRNIQNSSNMAQVMYITIGERTQPVTLVDNAATQALVAALAEGTFTYEADDYGGFEKVGSLGRSLPTSNEQITTEAGDVILYNGNSIVLFYGANSWSYTRLGRIQYDSLAALKMFLKAGQGRISVTLSVGDPTGIRHVQADGTSSKAYTLQGTLAQAGRKGIIIKDGKKYVK